MKLPNATHVLTAFRSLTAVFVLALGMVLAVSTRAATWTVTSTNDLRYIDAGSLGYILQYLANSGDTINFATNLSGQNVVLSSFGQLTLSGKNLTIDASALPGGVTIVTAYPNYRILEVDSGTVVLNKLTLTGGAAGGGAGGGIYIVGGTLTLNQCTVSGNSGANGGAIYNNGTLTLNQCTVSGNSGGGIGGGGVYNSGTLTLSQCTLSGNSAGTGWGGGIYNTSSGNLAMTNCSLFGNSAGVGGGVASDAGTTLTMTGCTLSTNSVGGGSGGGIFSGATLMLNQCILSGNSAAHGGGIYIGNNTSGTMTLVGCTLSGNSANGALGLGGGGIYNSTPIFTLTLANCILSGNSANGTTYGGGGINNAGSLALTNCTLSGNLANGTTYGGGGIYNSYTGNGSVTLNGCTLSGNWTSNTIVGGGGGIANNAGTLTLNQCTLSGNSASYTVEGGGGGIDNRSGPVTLYQCTVSGNSVPSYAEGGGIYNGFGGTVNLTNSIVAANSGPFGADIINFRILNYAGANIVESVDTVPFYTTQVNGPAVISAAPLLAPLGNYGGPTQTMPPLPGSPALDASSDSATNMFATDQRGYPRLVGAHVDLGAVEGVYNPTGASHLTSMARVGNGPASFTFTNSPYMSFTVLASTNAGLPLSAWSNLGAPVEAPSGSGHYQFTDAQATNTPQRFYCVRWP